MSLRATGERIREPERARGPWLVVGALAVALVGSGACSPRPTDEMAVSPSLAAAPRAQQELRTLEEHWGAASPAERPSLLPQLESFVRRHPRDPGTQRARVLLAWVLLDQGELSRAEAALAQALEGPESSTRDHARLLQAALLTRQGEPNEALALLEPLQGKLVGQEVTSLYGRERALAALEARRWRLLVAALGKWLDSSPQAQEDVRRSALASLARVPSHALVRLLEEQAAGPDGGRHVTQRWLERAITEQLVKNALAAGDSRLSRKLLEVGPSWLRASPEGERLVLLSRETAGEVRIEGRTLGVVLEEEDAAARRRSAAVLAGVVEALGMGRADRDASVRLVVRENRGNMAGTLAALASEGASVLIAGVDDLGALVALAFAEERRVPVMVLVDPPDRRAELAYGFVVGTGRSVERSLLEPALAAQGAEQPEVIGEGGHACQGRGAHAGAQRFPWASWQREGRVGALLFADATCARRAATEARSFGKAAPLGFGLEAAQILTEGVAEGALGLGAGTYPVVGGAPAGWYELLGRDAARLASAALAVVPEDTDVDGEAVRAHLGRARDALRKAEAPLESTAATGFRGKQVLARELRVLQASGGELRSVP